MQGLWVRSLVREMRSHMLHGAAKKKSSCQITPVKLLVRHLDNRHYDLNLCLPPSFISPAFLGLYSLSHVQLLLSPWLVVCQAPPSMGLPKQEYWNGMPFPTPEDLPNSGIKHVSLASALTGGFFTTEPPEKFRKIIELRIKKSGSKGTWAINLSEPLFWGSEKHHVY